MLSVCANIFEGFVGKAVEIVKEDPSRQVQGYTTPSLYKLLEAVLQADDVVNTPILCDTILQSIIRRSETATDVKKAGRTLLPGMFLDAMRKPQLKELATVTRQQLLERPPLEDLRATADELALLIRLDGILAGTVIKPADWRAWLDFSRKLSPGKGISPASASSLTATIHMLEHIFERLWSRAVATPKTNSLSEILLWTKESIKTSTDIKAEQSSIMAAQVFLSRAERLETRPDDIIPSKKLEKLHVKFMRFQAFIQETTC